MSVYRYCLIVNPGAEETLRHLEVGCFELGAAADADIKLTHDTVSRRHARIEVLADGGVVIRDHGSTNGTRVNGKPVSELAIVDGCELMFGTVNARLMPVSGQQAEIAVHTRQPNKGQQDGDIEASVTATAAGETARAALGAVARALGAARPIREVVSEVLNTWVDVLPVTGLAIRMEPELVVAQAGECQGDPAQQLTQGASTLQVFGTADRLPNSLRGPGRMLLMMLAEQAGQVSPNSKEQKTPRFPGIETLDPALKKTLAECARIALGTIPVLIHGESGSGKELLARWIHQCSPRAEQPFRAVNCAAVPENLLEAELFGVARGAATGVEARDGVIAQASGGTLFLDEIGDMSGDVQVRLLRAIEEGQIWPVGAQAPVAVDVRFVSATHRDLHQRVAERSFRLDLLHRLAAFEANLPPLRERVEDIPALVTFFLNQALRESNKSCPGVTTAALSRLLAWHWPGNVRELRNEVQRAVLLLDDGEPLDLSRLSPRLQELPDAGSLLQLEVVVRHAERRAFAAALSCANGNPAEAMSLLGLSRSSYYRKLKELELDGNDREIDSAG